MSKIKQFKEVTFSFDIFNFLRGIALLCVLGLHTVCVIGAVYPEIPHSWLFNTPAWLAMWMFFFLSGYLLGKGFYNNKYKTDISGIKMFYLSRLIRILPMYLFFLFIIFLFYDPVFFITHPKTVLHLLTFTYNGKPGIAGVGATWFISTIVQLYFIAPLFYKFIGIRLKHLQWKPIFFLILLGLGYRLMFYYVNLDYYKYCFTFSLANLDLFLGGMLLNSVTMNSRENNLKKYLRPLSLISLFVLIFMYMYPSIHISHVEYFYYYPTLTLISLILIVYSFDVPLNSVHIVKIFAPFKYLINFIEYLGIISFTFYLYHSNILEIFMKIFKAPALANAYTTNHLYIFTFLGMFVTTFILSVALHHMIEIPTNNLRAKLIKREVNYVKN